MEPRGVAKTRPCPCCASLSTVWYLAPGFGHLHPQQTATSDNSSLLGVVAGGCFHGTRASANHRRSLKPFEEILPQALLCWLLCIITARRTEFLFGSRLGALWKTLITFNPFHVLGIRQAFPEPGSDLRVCGVRCGLHWGLVTNLCLVQGSP